MEALQPVLAGFGSLLRTARMHRRLTQHQLATRLGMHVNTISAWELGTYLPSTRSLVLELARLLALDELATRQLLEASLTALAPYWSVPLLRNPYFTGREEMLAALHTQLGIKRTVALTQSAALYGLGGVGKTQLALEYAYRYALDYRAVFWMAAETAASITSSLLHIAETLQLPERADKDQQYVIIAVQRWLTTHGQWLMIWDNVEDLALLDRSLPPTRSGAILLTTRHQALGTRARGIALSSMAPEEGVLLLLRRAKVLEPDASRAQLQQFAQQRPTLYAAALELVEALGGLPLALDQAGAYLEETHCGLPAYLEHFCMRRATLLQQRGEETRDHPASVSTTFTLAITATAERHPAVQDLLRVCAQLQADGIPEELFRRGSKRLGPRLEVVCRDELEWDRVVGMACSYSLLSRQPEEQTLSIHRLVQAVLLESMSQEEQAQGNRCVVAAVDAVFPEVRRDTEYALRKQCDRLLPHALHSLRQLGPYEESLAVASLAYKVALALHIRARYAEAEPLHLRALHVREQALGPDHPDVASSLHALALLSWKQGKYAEAEPLYLRALHIREHVLGGEHLDVASLLNDLGNLYWTQHRNAEAEPLSLRALRIRELTLGPDHPDIAYSLNNLIMIYGEQDRYAEAEPLSLRALHIREQALAPDHPAVAISLHNLGNLYREQGRYAEAEPLSLRALHILEHAQGLTHPDVAYSLHTLAELYHAQGKDAEAESLYLRALHIWEQTLGDDHSLVAHPLHNLAHLYQEQGRYKEAEVFYVRALSIRETLGQHHPEIAETLHDLALLRQKQGNLSEACSCAERAHAIRSQSLGDTHPQTVATQALHAQLLQEQTCAEGKAAPEHSRTTLPASRVNEPHKGSVSFPLHDNVPPAPSEDDPLQAFLDDCCDVRPRAWCRSADLWQAYTQWAEDHQERYPLSRGTFIAQLKQHGCHAHRTRIARVWRGIALVKQARDGG